MRTSKLARAATAATAGLAVAGTAPQIPIPERNGCYVARNPLVRQVEPSAAIANAA